MAQSNMMPNAMQPQNSIFRPQPQNGAQQLHAKIMEDLRVKVPHLPPGWQSTFDIRERAGRIMQLVSGLRIIQPDTMKCVTIAESFEERTILESQNKEIYLQKMSNKMGEVQVRRQQSMQSQQMPVQNGVMQNNNMGMPPNNMGNMNAMQNGMGGMVMNMNMGNMGMNGMNGMPNGGNVPQNQAFPAQLQRPMQPSPLPPQQGQQQGQPQPAQQQNNTLNPAALQNPQMAAQMQAMNQAGQQHMNQGNQPQPGQPNMNQGAQAQSMQPTAQEVTSLARQMYMSFTDEKKNTMRQNFLNSLTPEQRQALQNNHGQDPLIRALANKARELIIARKMNQLNQNGQPGGAGVQMNNANNQQTPVTQSGAPNFDITSMLGQQQNAIKAAESGDQVVPASNNNMNLGMGAQVNGQQGVNPQMLGNQGNQNGNGNQFSMQFMQAQNQKRQELLAKQKQQQAQQQAMAQRAQNQNQQNQLQGQPGGLNGGQVNSPAMNMLNRPMAPPGQTTPATPQQNRPQGMPQTPVNGASQLQQHHQQMLTQNMQTAQAGQQALSQKLAALPQQVREKLQNMAPAQVNEILAKLAQSRQNQQGGMMNNQQGGPGMPPGLNIGGQMPNQGAVMPGIPQNIGNAIPGFNAPPGPNQQQQNQNGQNLQLQQRMQQHQQAQLRQRAMDMREFPRMTLQSLGIDVPPNVIQWGQLKAHVAQNPQAMQPGTAERVQALQNSWFESHKEEMQQAMQVLQQRMQAAQTAQQANAGQGRLGGARAPSAMTGPNGQAPPAQMVPPGTTMPQNRNQNQATAGQNANLAQFQAPSLVQGPVGDNEIKMFREKVPNSHRMTDEQIKAALERRKAQYANEGQMRTQNLLQAQQRITQQNQQQPARPPQQQAPNQQPNGQQQGQKRAQGGNDDVMEIPNPNARAAGVAQAPQAQMNQPQPSLQNPLPNLTPEQLAKMNPAQRKAFQQRIEVENLRRAQTAAQQQAIAANGQGQGQQQIQTPAKAQANQMSLAPGGIRNTSTTEDERTNMQALFAQVHKDNPKGPPLQLDSRAEEQARTLLRKLYHPLQNIDKTFLLTYRTPQTGPERLKGILRARLIVSQNAKEENGNVVVKDYLSVGPEELLKIDQFLRAYVTELNNIQKRHQQQAGAAPAAGQIQPAAKAAQAQQPPQPQKPSQQQPPKVERKPSQQGHGRKASTKDNKAPPAPTENKSFDWGAPSPHGVPKYDPNQTNLTADKLKFPPTKKRKTGDQQPASQGSTPANLAGTPGTTGSPSVSGASKVPSPEQSKKAVPAQQAPPQAPEKPKFKCDDLHCEGNVVGFESQELLVKHKNAVHQVIEDPFKFLAESASEAFGLDLEGKPILPVAAKDVRPAAQQPRGKPMPTAARPGSKKEDQTPSVKQEGAATPITPASVGKGKASATPAGKKPADDKMPDSTVQVKKEPTLMETMTSKLGFQLPPDSTSSKEFPNVSVDFPNDDIWVDNFQASLGGNLDAFGAGAGANDLSEFVGVGFDNWGMMPELGSDSSPELTPSSRESDISQSDLLRINLEWDAFGNGDTGVPEGLMQTLGLGDSNDGPYGDDVVMGGAAEEGDGGKNTMKVEDQWNWGSGADLTDWDAVFGAEAGLKVQDGEGMELFDAAFAFS